MKVLYCIACESDAGPQLSLGQILGTLEPGGESTLLHVLGRGEDHKAAESCLARARAKLTAGVIETKVRRGDPFSEILAEVEDSGVDLLVLGPSEAPGLRRDVLGSVTTQVIRRVPSSVLVARQTRSSLKRILIGSSGADVADSVIETGARIARSQGASATLMHVLTSAPSFGRGPDLLSLSLTELLQTDTPVARHLRNGAEILRQHQVPAELRVRYGVVSDEMIREARRGENDLILLGAAKGRPPAGRFMLGDVTEQVVERAPMSVLIVRDSLCDTS